MSNFLRDTAEASVKEGTKALADDSLSTQSQDLWKALGEAGQASLRDGLLLGRGFLKADKFTDFLKEAKMEQNAQDAADIIDRRDDMGTDYQKAKLQEMFEEAKKNGTEQELADAINKKLEERGCHCRIKIGGAADLNDPQSMFDRGTTVSLVDSDNPKVVIDNFYIGNKSNALKGMLRNAD